LTAQIPVGLTRLLNPPDYTEESEQRVVVLHGDVRPTNVLHSMFLLPLSSRREVFNADAVISSPHLISVFEERTGSGAGFLVCAQGTQPVQQAVEFRVLAEGLSSASATIERPTPATGIESAFHAGLSELRGIVSAIRQGRPLASTPEFDVLLTRAARAHGTPENIEEWARQLAEDISDLVD